MKTTSTWFGDSRAPPRSTLKGEWQDLLKTTKKWKAISLIPGWIPSMTYKSLRKPAPTNSHNTIRVLPGPTAQRDETKNNKIVHIISNLYIDRKKQKE